LLLYELHSLRRADGYERAVRKGHYKTKDRGRTILACSYMVEMSVKQVDSHSAVYLRLNYT